MPRGELVGVGEAAQGGLEDLAGLANQGGTIHRSGGIGERSGHADADGLILTTEQRAFGAARRVLVDLHFALEGRAADAVAADVEQVGISAKELAVAEYDYAAALAGPSVEQIDVDRIQPVLHLAPVVVTLQTHHPVSFMPKPVRARQRGICRPQTTERGAGTAMPSIRVVLGPSHGNRERLTGRLGNTTARRSRAIGAGTRPG